MKLPPCPLSLVRRVDFSQTDAAGIMHFSAYFTFMEAAEAELFRDLGLPFLWTEGETGFGFPRLDCQCAFRRPLQFDDLVETRLQIDQIRSGRLHYRFTFFNEAAQECAAGSMVTAFVSRSPDHSLTGCPLPERHRTALTSWKNQPV